MQHSLDQMYEMIKITSLGSYFKDIFEKYGNLKNNHNEKLVKASDFQVVFL